MDEYDDNDLLGIVDGYAEENITFDNSFAKSLHAALSEYGELTDGQRAALVNIVKRFRMLKR